MTGEPEDAGAARPTEDATGRVDRVETAVAPVIRGDSVAIPTPAWGVQLPDDVETVDAELVDGEPAAREPDEEIVEPEWGPLARQWPGWLALLVAVGTAVVTGVAVAADAWHDSEAATILAWVAIGCSIAAFLGGVLAAVFNRGRLAGLVAALVGLFADPWILLQVLTLLKG